jgi:hypothetical protein
MILALALAQFIASYAGRAVPRRRRAEAAGITLGFSAGIEAYEQHDTLQHGQPPIPAASGARKGTGSADGKTG